MRNALLLFFVLLLLWTPQYAGANRNRWQNLEQVSTGQEVTVIDCDHNRLSGRFLRFSDSDITLSAAGLVVTVRKDKVSRIVVKTGHRGRNTLIGALAGGAFGGVMGGLFTGSAKGIPYGGLGFGAPGAGIGALIPVSKTIYQATKVRRGNTGLAGGSSNQGHVSGKAEVMP